MAKTKAKTRKARIIVFYDSDGHYAAAGETAFGVAPTIPDKKQLLAESDNMAVEELPHACIVDVELPIPELSKAKVVKVRQVKP